MPDIIDNRTTKLTDHICHCIRGIRGTPYLSHVRDPQDQAKWPTHVWSPPNA